MKTQGNILFCGVGGQGILLASEITAHALLEAGFDLKKSEVHGMAQRGGSVVAHLRYGPKVYSPLIEPGTVDIEVAFEPVEAARYLYMLNKNSKVIINNNEIPPPAVNIGKMNYPENIIEKMKDRDLYVTSLDATDIGANLGNARTANIVLVGAASCFMPIEEEVFLTVLKKRIPERFLEVNLAAFAQGRLGIKN
jgi:indolepyruvate ferredoxin oxidoreductase, beta subunit